MPKQNYTMYDDNSFNTSKKFQFWTRAESQKLQQL